MVSADQLISHPCLRRLVLGVRVVDAVHDLIEGRFQDCVVYVDACFDPNDSHVFLAASFSVPPLTAPPYSAAIGTIPGEVKARLEAGFP